LKRQKNQKQLLGLRLINKLRVKKLYILDASAVLDDPEIGEYNKKYLKEKDSIVFIITTACLKEIDDQKYKSKNTRKNYKIFMQKLREFCIRKKLSNGKLIFSSKGTKEYIIYYPYDLKKIEDEKYEWLQNEYPDRQLLCFARMLKKSGKKTGIISGDSLLKVLCKEEGIKYIYVPISSGDDIQSSDTTSEDIKKLKITIGTPDDK